MANKRPESLADFVFRSKDHKANIFRTNPLVNKSDPIVVKEYDALCLISSLLPKAKRIGFDSSINTLIEATYSVPTEDIIGQITESSFPFDLMWFELNNSIDGHNANTGVLIRSNPKDQSFSFRYATTVQTEPKLQHITKMIGALTEDCRILVTEPIDVYVSKNGITFDDDIFSSYLEMISKGDAELFASTIDKYYDLADKIARLFVILGSAHIPSNFNRAALEQGYLQDIDANKRRMRLGGKPRLDATPIVIDLSKVDLAKMAKMGEKGIRELLGWTSVRRSKPIMKKDGTFFTRRPHERRIPAPIDRREVTRIITASGVKGPDEP